MYIYVSKSQQRTCQQRLRQNSYTSSEVAEIRLAFQKATIFTERSGDIYKAFGRKSTSCDVDFFSENDEVENAMSSLRCVEQGVLVQQRSMETLNNTGGLMALSLVVMQRKRKNG